MSTNCSWERVRTFSILLRKFLITVLRYLTVLLSTYSKTNNAIINAMAKEAMNLFDHTI